MSVTTGKAVKERLGKGFFVEFLELRLSNTNVVTSRIGQLKAPIVAI